MTDLLSELSLTMQVEKVELSQGGQLHLEGWSTDQFDALTYEEKLIARTAFRAAATASRSARSIHVVEVEPFTTVNPNLNEPDVLQGLQAAAAALRSIPRENRSLALNSVLDACGCSPDPELP